MTRGSDENAALRALRESLTEEGGGHPAEELLLEYSDKRSSLATDVVERIDAHLAQCPSCRDEVGVLGAMTIRPSGVLASGEGRADNSFWQRIVAAVSAPAWRPALALAVLVVLMVPSLRLIRQGRFLMQDGIDRGRDDAMTVTEIGPGRAARGGGTTALKSAPAMTDGLPPQRVEEAHEAPRQELQRELRTGERQMAAARENESRSLDSFSVQAMEKDRGIARSSAPVPLDYVPGGRVSITPGDIEHLTLRITFARGSDSAAPMRAVNPRAPDTNAAVVVVPAVSEVELRVTTADGRENRRRVDVGLDRQAPSSPMVDIPAGWLAAGENRVDILSRDDRQLVLGSFVVDLRSPD